MNSVFKKTLAVTALSLGLAGVAQAGAVAFGSLEISNFIIWRGSTADFNNVAVTGTQYNITDFAGITAGNVATASAGLDGASISDNSGPASPGNADVPMQCLGAACGGIAQNNYNLQMPVGTFGNFTRGDAELTGAIITGLPQGSPATSQQVAEGQLVSTSFGDASGEVTNGTAFAFTLATADNVVFQFDGQSIINTLLNANAVIPGSLAQAATSFNITVTHLDALGNTVVDFSWTPDGTGTIVGGISVSDPASLQEGRATLIPGTENNFDSGLNFYRGVTPFLNAGVAYTLNIQSNANMDIVKVVEPMPEPGVLALMSISIFGLGFLRRRKKA